MYVEKCVFVMPTYNTYEKQREHPSTYKKINSVLAELMDTINKELRGKQEIIIVNDGSTDETERELQKYLKRKKPRTYLKQGEKVNSQYLKAILT